YASLPRSFVGINQSATVIIVVMARLIRCPAIADPQRAGSISIQIDLIAHECVRRHGQYTWLRSQRAERCTQLLAGGGTNLAEILGQNQEGSQLPQQLLVDLIEAVASCEALRDGRVDLPRAQLLQCERWPHDGRAVARRRWEIALVRHPDYLIAQAQCEGHLGRRWQQRDDAQLLSSTDRVSGLALRAADCDA